MGKRVRTDGCYAKVVQTIEKYNLMQDGDKIVVGVSGGPDSICLLDILKNLRNESILKKHENEIENCQKGASPMAIKLVVAHVNHMIRREASDDEQYVKDFCVKNDIEFYSKSIDVQKLANNNKIGTEEAGRKARYEFFDEVLEKTNANKIAIAHNKNDSVETIFMHVLRGSGISGLKGIEAKRGKYIRPLIECERKDIEKYCDEKNLEPRIDKTNFENIYTRNKIRNVVIPYVQKEFNPNIIETIDRLSKLVSEEEDYMDNQVKKAYQKVLIAENETVTIKDEIKIDKNDILTDFKERKLKEIQLDLKKFNNEEKVIKSRLILYTITRLFGNINGIERIHIEDILKLCSNNIGNKFLTPNKNIKVLIKNQKIYFISKA